jgi:hypothetical protein
MQDNFALSGHHVMHQKGLSGCRGELLGSCGAGIAGAEHCSKKDGINHGVNGKISRLFRVQGPLHHCGCY